MLKLTTLTKRFASVGTRAREVALHVNYTTPAFVEYTAAALLFIPTCEERGEPLLCNTHFLTYALHC